jgi:tetratricopeptide (TPR) repeat protein
MHRDTTSLPFPAWLAAPVLVFTAVLAVLTLLNRAPAPQGSASSDVSSARPAPGDTQAAIASLQEAVRADSTDPGAYAALGDAYYQRGRETGDPSFYSRAERAFDAAVARDGAEPTATLGLATLALARHDFRAGLELARSAHELEPGLVRPYAAIADAQIELGRYGAAGRTLDRLVSLKPTLAAYSRVSYYRELHGDLAGAVAAMRLAVAAGGGSAENRAYVSTLLGGLEITRGEYGAAERAYRSALAADPGYPPALAGLARLDGARGALDAAIRRYRTVVERLPLPEYAIALAEAEEAAGRAAAAERDYALVEAEARLFQAAGVNTDVELAIFEADHGDPGRAVALGRGVWRRAPSVRSADAYSWALHSADRDAAALRMSKEAMRLGSRDPYFLYHAGVIAADAGATARAEALLGQLLRQSPAFSPFHGPLAERALEALR